MHKPIERKRLLLLVALAALGAAACDRTAVDPGDLLAGGEGIRAQPPRATVVLVHGMGGFRSLGPLDYFFHIPPLWQRQGAKVYAASETPFATVEARAAELKRQLDRIEGPLVLVGHSQGGLDARWLVTKLGYARRVRAVVTIATPHQGSPIADVAVGLMPGPIEEVLNVLVGTLGWSLDGANQITTRYMRETFNPSVPDAQGVAYWSYAGKASPLGTEDGSGWLHAALLPTWSVLKLQHLDSDGIVPVESQKWGRLMGIIPGDHLGEVNQPLGETPGFHALRFYGGMLQAMHDEGW